MTIEKKILQLLKWTALKVNHCAIKPNTAKGYKIPGPSQKAVALAAESVSPKLSQSVPKIIMTLLPHLELCVN